MMFCEVDVLAPKNWDTVLEG